MHCNPYFVKKKNVFCPACGKSSKVGFLCGSILENNLIIPLALLCLRMAVSPKRVYFKSSLPLNSNEVFLPKAPQEVVSKEKGKIRSLEKKIEKLERIIIYEELGV